MASDGAMISPSTPPDPPNPPDPPDLATSLSFFAAPHRRCPLFHIVPLCIQPPISALNLRSSPPLFPHSRRPLLVGSTGSYGGPRRPLCCDARGWCRCFGCVEWPRYRLQYSLSGSFPPPPLIHPSISSVALLPVSATPPFSAGSILCTGEQTICPTSFLLPFILSPSHSPVGPFLCTVNRRSAAVAPTSSSANPRASMVVSISWVRPIKNVVVCHVGLSPNPSSNFRASDGLLTEFRRAISFFDPASSSTSPLPENYVLFPSLWERLVPLSSFSERHVKHSSLNGERSLPSSLPLGENTVPPCSFPWKGSVLPELKPETSANLLTKSALAFSKGEVWLSKSQFKVTKIHHFGHAGKSLATHWSHDSNSLSCYDDVLSFL